MAIHKPTQHLSSARWIDIPCHFLRHSRQMGRPPDRANDFATSVPVFCPSPLLNFKINQLSWKPPQFTSRDLFGPFRNEKSPFFATTRSATTFQVTFCSTRFYRQLTDTSIIFSFISHCHFEYPNGRGGGPKLDLLLWKPCFFYSIVFSSKKSLPVELRRQIRQLWTYFSKRNSRLLTDELQPARRNELISTLNALMFSVFIFSIIIIRNKNKNENIPAEMCQFISFVILRFRQTSLILSERIESSTR